MDWNGKVVVLTGAGSGMGREMALQLLAKGAVVAAVDVSEARLAETARLAGPREARLSRLTVDITDQVAVAALPGQVVARHGAVDAVINNAGIIQPFVKLDALGWDAIDRVMRVNWYGTLYMTKAFLPHLRARPEAYLCNVSSMGGFLPVPGQTIYGATKAAVKLLTEGLHSELAGTNVHVTVVFPGAVGTDIAKNSGVAASFEVDATKAAPKVLAAHEAARQIIAGIEARRYRVLVGNDAKVMDALARLAPERAARLIYKQMRGLLS